MKELYLVRHGETLYNLQNRLQGHSDSPLSEKGIFQAEVSAKYIAQNKNIDHIYASDLGRAIKTAEIFSKHLQTDISKRSDLREIAQGKLEGMTYSEIEAHYGKSIMQKFHERHLDLVVDEGESPRESLHRFGKALEEIMERHPEGSNILVITHGLILTNFLCHLKNVPENTVSPINIENGSITHLTFESNKWYLKEVGECAHLHT